MNQRVIRTAIIVGAAIVGLLGVRFGIWDQEFVDGLMRMNGTQDQQDQADVSGSSASTQSAPGSAATAEIVAQLPSDQAPQCGRALEIEAEDFPALFALGQEVGVRYPATFARVVDHLYDEDRLPPCYLSKDEARDQGWQSGGGTLEQAAPGTSIGGDYFGNREGRLPTQYNGDYREADLDYVRGSRGAARLVYVRGRADEGLVWVTTDHYDSFVKIYCGDAVC